MGDAAGERAFVAKSWVESYASSSMSRLISTAGGAPDIGRAWRITQEYWDTWHVLVNALLERCTTVLACDDMGLLAGFLCWEPWQDGACVHYIYTRLMYRRQGLARQFANSVTSCWPQVYYTHRSRGMPPVPEGWRYSLRPLLGVRKAA